MAYKSILTVVTDPAVLAATLTIATDLCRAEAAHLDVLCIGLDRTQLTGFYPGDGAILLDQTLQQAQTEAEALYQSAKALLQQQDIRWSLDWGSAQMGGTGTLVAERARFVDLVVVPRPAADAQNRDADLIIEAALFDGGVPVLVVPQAGLPPDWGENVIVGWNQSREAMRAIRGAMPLLLGAKSVSITIIDPPRHGPERSDPGGPVSQMLARHGIHAEVSVLAKTMPRVSDVLKRHARDKGATLIVMGAYGHSRLREFVFGGATRAMIDGTEVPVFLAH